MSKDNTPDELDTIIEDWRTWQHYCQDEGYGCEYEQFIAYGRENTRCKLLRESDDWLKQKLRDYIAREIDAVIGANETHWIDRWGEEHNVPTDDMMARNDARDDMRSAAADRGWRIES